MVWKGHCWVAHMLYPSGLLPSNSQPACTFPPVCVESYTWAPMSALLSSLPAFSCSFKSKAKKDILKRDDGFKSPPPRLLYQMAATCEQYFNQENRNCVLTRRTTAMAEGAMEEWSEPRLYFCGGCGCPEWTCPCFSLLQEEARPPVMSSGQTWKRSGKIFLRVTRPSSCPCLFWDFKPYSAAHVIDGIDTVDYSLCLLLSLFFVFLFNFTAVVQYIFKILYWKEILVKER